MAKVMTAKGSKGPKAKRSKKTTTATKPETQTSSVSTFDNQRDRAALIRKTVADIAALDAKIEALQAEKRGIKNERIKGKLGMKVKDFNFAANYHDMERDSRADFTSTLREVSSALKTGETINFLDVIEKQDRDILATIEQNRDAIQDPYEAGRQAGLEVRSQSDNPFPAKSKQFRDWDRGHHDGVIQKLTGGGSAAAPADEEDERETAGIASFSKAFRCTG